MKPSLRTVAAAIALISIGFAQFGCNSAPSREAVVPPAKQKNVQVGTVNRPASQPAPAGAPSTTRTGNDPYYVDDAGRPRQSSAPGDAKEEASRANTEGYQDYGVNPLTDTRKDSLSTFAIDVDTASYTIARRKLNEGTLPPPASVRVEEFVNFFTYNYPQPATEHPFSIALEGAPSPFTPGRHLLRVGLHGREIPVANRPPAHLTFLVDTSGSMQSEDKIGLLKQSLRELVNHLKPGDTVAITTYAGSVSTVLTPTDATHRNEILRAIGGLETGGSTAMAAGIELAYRQAAASAKPGAINRIIICSDGDANVGPSTPEATLKLIEGYVRENITVSTIGFGMGNYKDTMMERFADKGNGNYYYIDSFKEAERVFGEGLTGTLQVIAKDVKVQVEFNPATVARYRLIGYENRDVADVDFRNDQVDGGEIGAGHRVTALYELELTEKPGRDVATVRLRYKAPEGTTSQEVFADYATARMPQQFGQASEDFRFAVAVASFAEVLRGSGIARTWSLSTIANIAREAAATGTSERQEFVALVAKAQQLRQSTGEQIGRNR
ncbi:MAG: von Willebrand factor type A domain-containing protein [Blastocatellia bacterium]|nr:von Willebrand factor type A domain-containing protein [Blastocatellia bacterium]